MHFIVFERKFTDLPYAAIYSSITLMTQNMEKGTACSLQEFYSPMSISIITTVKRLSAHLTHKRLLARVYPSVFLKVLRIDKCRLTHITFIRSFASMRRLYMIIQQSPPLESLTTILTFVTFIVIVGRPFMRLQI